jgi:predicted TIM-barrel fold metal-dependent hydrolase
MKPYAYFDALCFLGRSVYTREGQPETAEALLAEMDHYGIHDALVIDTLSAEASPRAGNERIIERTRQHPRLHPAWAGLMTHSRELPPPRELVAQMREHGVGALFLFYGQFDIRLDSWGIDDLLTELQASRVPLFLCATNFRQAGAIDTTDWTAVVNLCRRFPELPVVVTEGRVYKSQRAVYAALAACPNLKIDVSSMWLHERVEFICREFGADRLVWASLLPKRNPGGLLMQVSYSSISQRELKHIAGGTMRQLLSWNENVHVVGTRAKLAEPVDDLHRAARERLPLHNEHFYDCHGHIGWSSPHHVVNVGLADMVEEMNKFGIQSCCVFSLEGVMGDETYGNDEVAEAVRTYPDRFVGFTLVTPNHGEVAMQRELERGMKMGLRGVKLICDYQGYSTEGPLIDVACEFANQHGQFILNHNWGSAEQMRRLCKTFPNACFITGHTTLAFAEVAKEVNNLFICTCPCIDWGFTEKLVAAYGADRILFGSDLTDLPIGWGMGQILYARIPEADKRNIMGGNMKALLKKHAGGTRGQ